ncbi:hypothetical protein [Pseudoxanthomonas winnipegensis]|uniref:hypothetical protein n=1 Tax=Pseudoxanthomonas winnipegensis TaxID=2480810 RepID=UPI00103EF19D|nr:hypothetical protein [Pseudoxanthomonas winnipegensis]TBV76864.1 hypothetical protein EYC45_01480 [Pseudoxanthomonas winnipegensis]
MALEIDIDKHRREETRWRILRILDAGRPWPVSEGLIMAALEDIELAPTVTELRKHVKYLRDKALVDILGEDLPTWNISLTANGTDVVEYSAPCPAGIRRPAKFG